MDKTSLNPYSTLLRNKSQTLLSLTTEANNISNVIDSLSLLLDDKQMTVISDLAIKTMDLIDQTESSFLSLNFELKRVLNDHIKPIIS